MTPLVEARVGVQVGRLLAQCRRSGDWKPAADWLAKSLNSIADRAPDYRTLGLEQRVARAETMCACIEAVDGDQRQPDVIWLPDGSRVCWHLERRRALTRWVAEAAGESCAFGQRG